MIEITEEQVDKAWEFTDTFLDERYGAMAAFEAIGIFECKECSGEGHEMYLDGAWNDDPCEFCGGHGWVQK